MAVHPVRVLSLCSGIGGLDLGVDLAMGGRCQHVALVEREAFAVSHLVAAMEAGVLAHAPIWSDVASFPGREVRGRVDLVVGGYPCQPFSHAGKRRGADDPRHLWPHIRRLLVDTDAPLAFFENVRGHVSLGLREVLDDLASLGFDAEWGVFRASDVGATHQRARLFILAYRGDHGRSLCCTTDIQESKWRDTDGCHPAMADASNDHRRSGIGTAEAGTGPDVERRRRLAGGGEAVADAGCHVRTQGGSRTRSGALGAEAGGEGRAGDKPASAPERGGGGVGNAVVWAHELGECDCCGEPWCDKHNDHYADCECRGPMDDAEHERLEGQSGDGDDQRRRAVETRPVAASGVRLFPPGPADIDGWRSWLEQHPGTEPAVRRDADGLSDRVDRLRALGNAVVPLQAAVAFRVLADRAAGGGA